MDKIDEEFTPQQKKILERFVTSTSGSIFALRNLPEVIKGALFSRYSRSPLGLRALLLKEFIESDSEGEFDKIVGVVGEEEGLSEQSKAIQKAQNFYDRILDGYGDDSIGELGGAHLAIENISMLAAKVIEDHRIGGSPLEKSTRYIRFDQKVRGDYLYYREPVLMTSAYRDSYVSMCRELFQTYQQLIAPLTAVIQEQFPHDPEISQAAYNASLRAKVFDCLRGLLPAGTLTNMGLYGNGRFFEGVLHQLHCHNLTELRDIGRHAFEELHKVIPSFVRRADFSHRTHQSTAQYLDAMQTELRLVTDEQLPFCERTMESGVRLLRWDSDAVVKVAHAMLFSSCDRSLSDLWEHCLSLSEEELARILDAGCNSRETRRHKSPRALEHAFFTFEVVTDFGAYRDLHRHRMLTQERQLLTCDYGYSVPDELVGLPEEELYHQVLGKAKRVYDQIAQELPEEAQYVVPMAYRIRWYFHANLRALQWLCELRSSAAGHPMYREVAQEMAGQVIAKFPLFERFFKFVDYDQYKLGRIGQEQRRVDRQRA